MNLLRGFLIAGVPTAAIWFVDYHVWIPDRIPELEMGGTIHLTAMWALTSGFCLIAVLIEAWQETRRREREENAKDERIFGEQDDAFPVNVSPDDSGSADEFKQHSCTSR